HSMHQPVLPRALGATDHARHAVLTETYISVSYREDRSSIIDRIIRRAPTCWRVGPALIPDLPVPAQPWTGFLRSVAQPRIRRRHRSSSCSRVPYLTVISPLPSLSASDTFRPKASDRSCSRAAMSAAPSPFGMGRALGV